MLRFTIRDLLWLMVVVAIVFGYWLPQYRKIVRDAETRVQGALDKAGVSAS